MMMKSMLKLIRRSLLLLLISMFLLLIFNGVFFISVTASHNSGGSIWTAAETVAGSLSPSSDGLRLSEEGRKTLKEYGAWAILIEDKSGNTIWESDNLPEEIPDHYSAAEIARAVNGYICDYPTSFSRKGDHLLILGLPKTGYWKLMWPAFDYNFIANLPKLLLIGLLCNLGIVSLIYFLASSGIFRSVKPILKGIQELPEGKEVYVRERGLLSELASSINQSAEKLRSQEHSLKKKETARANWIAGVSHDIRTPLSMIMGYAGQLEEDAALSGSQRQKAAVIRRQSEKIRDLVSDLNLASRLEYNMQPLHLEICNLVAIARQASVDFINNDIEGRYPIRWLTKDSLSSCLVRGDSSLLQRAVANVVQNSMNHNDNGCRIDITVEKSGSWGIIRVDDNGAGVEDWQLDKLRNTPHYMVCDENTGPQRHGLGLLIVRQILEAHHGNASFDHSKEGGFSVLMKLPLADSADKRN